MFADPYDDYKELDSFEDTDDDEFVDDVVEDNDEFVDDEELDVSGDEDLVSGFKPEQDDYDGWGDEDYFD